MLPVQMTSAIELDEATTREHRRLDRASGPARKVTLSTRVDPDILGGIVVQGRQLDPRRLDQKPTRAAAQAGGPGR